MKEGHFVDLSQDLKTHIVNINLIIHHLIKIIDRIKQNLHNCAPLYDVSANIKVLTNGIQGLKFNIVIHPGLPYDTIWSYIFGIYLVFDSTKLAAIEKTIPDLTSRQK